MSVRFVVRPFVVRPFIVRPFIVRLLFVRPSRGGAFARRASRTERRAERMPTQEAGAAPYVTDRACAMPEGTGGFKKAAGAGSTRSTWRRAERSATLRKGQGADTVRAAPGRRPRVQLISTNVSILPGGRREARRRAGRALFLPLARIRLYSSWGVAPDSREALLPRRYRKHGHTPRYGYPFLLTPRQCPACLYRCRGAGGVYTLMRSTGAPMTARGSWQRMHAAVML